LRQNLEISGRSGAELERMVGNILDTPPAILDSVNRAIELKTAEPAKGVRRGAE
jgi:hypothetical protein